VALLAVMVSLDLWVPLVTLERPVPLDLPVLLDHRVLRVARDLLAPSAPVAPLAGPALPDPLVLLD